MSIIKATNQRITGPLVPVIINGTDITSLDPKFAHVPEEDLITPKVELQARRAMSVFQALMEIKKEQGEGIFDRRTARYIREIEELKKIEDHLPPSIAECEADNNIKAIKFYQPKWHQRITGTFRNQLWIPRVIFDLFKIPKRFDLKKVLKEAQIHLGLSDDDLPRTIVTDDISYYTEQSTHAGQYTMHEDTLSVQTDGFRFFRMGSKAYNPSFRYWFDMLPKTIRDGLTYIYRDSCAIDLYVCHELTHKRQALNIQKLTLDEAKEVLEGYLERLDIQLKRFLLTMIIGVHNLELGNTAIDEKAESIYRGKVEDHEVEKQLIEELFKFLPVFREEREAEIIDEERSKCAVILALTVNEIFDRYLYPHRASANMERYIRYPGEIEARMEADAFMLEQSLQQLQEIKDTDSSKSRKNLPLALKYLKGFLVGRVINGILLRVARGIASKQEIKREEDKIKALKKLTHATSTSEYLETEDRLRRWEIAKKKS